MKCGTSEDHPSSERSFTARLKKMTKAVQERVTGNPKRSEEIYECE